MIGGGAQKITVEIGGKIAGSLGASLRAAQTQVSSFGRNVNRTMNDAALAGRKGFKGMFDNALWQQAAAGAAAIGVGMVASVRVAAKFEQSLTDISKTAQLTTDQTRKLGQEILRLTGRNETNQSAEQLAAGIKTLVGAGLTLEQARGAIRGIGRVATATGSEITDVANTSFQLMQNLKIQSGDVARAFEVLAAAGKQGSFELKDMAQQFPAVAASAQKLQIGGVKGAASLAAMLQIVRRGTADSSTAANNLVNLLEKLTGKEAVKNFQGFGVNIEKVVKDAQAKGLDPLEESLKVIQRITKGGDPFLINKLFGDMQVKGALGPLLKDFKDFQEIRDKSLGAKGVIDEDYQKQLKTFSETLKSFSVSAERLGITVGTALLPPLTRLAEKITPIVEGIANWATANPGLAKNIVVVTGVIAGLTLALPVIAGVVGAIGLLGGPVTWTILGIGAAIALVVANWGSMKKAAANAWTETRTNAIRTWWQIKGMWGQFTRWIGGVFNQALAVIKAWGGKVLGFFTPLPTQIIRLFTSSGIGQKIIGSIIDGLKAKAGELFGWIRGTWGRITGFFGGGGGAPATPAPAGNSKQASPIFSPPGRATGGPVRAGQPYIVGERRRELFVPGMDGAIIPRIARPAAGGGGVTIQAPVTIHAGGGNAMEIRDQVRMAFEDLIARAYGDYRVALND
jgi:TP901 family phage tail tape measure protein